MRLYYEGTDITRYADITRCLYHEAAGSRCDSLELELENAAAWYGWGPKTDDKISVVQDKLDTGTLYLNTILPEDGRFRILAASLPAAARKKAWGTFDNTTVSALLQTAAAACGMGSALFGVEGSLPVPFLLRQNEGYAALLDRLMQWEGAAVKAINGKITAIGILYAQSLAARQTFTLKADQRDVKHVRRSGTKYAGVTVLTPYAQAGALDTQAEGGDHPVYTHLPAMDAVTAGRWARGLLLHNNRQAETLQLPTALNPGLTPLARIDIQSSADFAGEWMVDDAVHDMKNNKTTARMVRCVESIQ